MAIRHLDLLSPISVDRLHASPNMAVLSIGGHQQRPIALPASFGMSCFVQVELEEEGGDTPILGHQDAPAGAMHNHALAGRAFRRCAVHSGGRGVVRLVQVSSEIHGSAPARHIERPGPPAARGSRQRENRQAFPARVFDRTAGVYCGAY